MRDEAHFCVLDALVVQGLVVVKYRKVVYGGWLSDQQLSSKLIKYLQNQWFKSGNEGMKA